MNGWASYVYDARGNLTTRTIIPNNTYSTYQYDPLDRVTWLQHFLTSGTRTFNYGYDDTHNTNNRLWTRRLGTTLGDIGDVFSYDLADQVIGVQLNVNQPQSTPTPAPNIIYDPNGNRTWYTPTGINKQYDPPSGVASNLNQYTSVIINGSQYNLAYRADANLAHYDYNNSTYYYDAQNRLTSATVGGTTMSFTYDGLNRQVSRTVGGVSTYNVWDGWDLIEEYQSANNGAMTAAYVYGAGGLIMDYQVGNTDFSYHYQDGSGSTSHIADSSGDLLEWYRYDSDGTPFFYAPNDTQRAASSYSVRHLFTGQQWYKEIGLYDLRNRFYSPDIGRFLQPDPIGF